MLVRITPPEPIITLDEAKQQLGLDSTTAAEDAQISALVAAATDEIDGQSWFGRALGPQVWELRLGPDPFWRGCQLPLPLPPLIAVELVKFRDGDGAFQSYDASNYSVYGVGAASGGIITLKNSAVWPVVTNDPESVVIRFRAGYEAGDPPIPAVPEPIRQAILLSVKHLWALGHQDLFLRRRTVEGIGSKEWAISEKAEQVITMTMQRLLSKYRVF